MVPHGVRLSISHGACSALCARAYYRRTFYSHETLLRSFSLHRCVHAAHGSADAAQQLLCRLFIWFLPF